MISPTIRSRSLFVHVTDPIFLRFVQEIVVKTGVVANAKDLLIYHSGGSWLWAQKINFWSFLFL